MSFGTPFKVKPAICIEGNFMEYDGGIDWSAHQDLLCQALTETRYQIRLWSMLKFSKREPFHGRSNFAAAVQGYWLLFDAASEEVKRHHLGAHRNAGRLQQ